MAAPAPRTTSDFRAKPGLRTNHKITADATARKRPPHAPTNPRTASGAGKFILLATVALHMVRSVSCCNELAIQSEPDQKTKLTLRASPGSTLPSDPDIQTARGGQSQ